MIIVTRILSDRESKEDGSFNSSSFHEFSFSSGLIQIHGYILSIDSIYSLRASRGLGSHNHFEQTC